MTDNSSYSPLMSGRENQEGRGGLVIVIVIIVLMLIGGLFVINAKKYPADETATTTGSTLQGEVNGTSTSLDDINTDINNVDASVSNSGLDQLDKEINSL